jgi:hypothetical protein
VSRGTSLKAGALVLSAALMLGGGDALAKKKGKAKKPGAIITRSASASASGTGSIVAATASCPGKTKAISGGFSQTPLNLGAGYGGLVYESQKVGQKSWRVSSQVIDSGAPDPISLTTFVYCRKNVKGTSAATAAVPSAAALTDGPSVAASCAGKKKAVAGGSFMNPPLTGSSATAVLTGSVPTGPTSWQSQVLSGGAGTNTLTSVAYCAKGKAPTTLSTTGPFPAGEVAVTTTVSCSGKKRKMIAGGFSETPQSSPPDGYIFIHESVRNGDKTWSVSGVKVGPGAVAPIAAGFCSA